MNTNGIDTLLHKVGFITESARLEGRPLTSEERNEIAMCRNLSKDWNLSDNMRRVIEMEGAQERRCRL